MAEFLAFVAPALQGSTTDLKANMLCLNGDGVNT